jgi:hypothetical protein
VALIAHLINTDKAVLDYVGRYSNTTTTEAVVKQAHKTFCKAVSERLKGPGEDPEHLRLLLLWMLQNDSPVVCWQAAEALAALVDCPDMADYIKEGLKRLMVDKGLTEEQLKAGLLRRPLELVEVYCEMRPMVAAAAALVLLGACQPHLFTDLTMKALVASGYCNSSSVSGNSLGSGSSNNMCLGRALVQLLKSEDDLVKQRAGVVVGGFCCDVAWTGDLWMDTWRGLNTLLASTCSLTRRVGLETLMGMVNNQPAEQQQQEELQDELLLTLQVVGVELVSAAAGWIGNDGGSASTCDEAEVKLQVQLLRELWQQLRSVRRMETEVAEVWRELSPWL